MLLGYCCFPEGNTLVVILQSKYPLVTQGPLSPINLLSYGHFSKAHNLLHISIAASGDLLVLQLYLEHDNNRQRDNDI